MARKATTGRKRVTLELRDDSAGSIFVAGSFNDWDPNKKQLSRDEDNGLHRATLMLPKGRHEYRFIVDGQWRTDPNCSESVPNPHGSLNSVLTV